MYALRFTAIFVAIVATANPSFAREWSDKTGNYRMKADLVAFSETSVVVKTESDDLVAIPINQLSDADQAFLATQTDALIGNLTKATQVWELKSGLKLAGRIAGFDRHELTFQRKHGKIYVNNQRYDKMPDFYRAIIPQLVEHFTSQKIDGEKGLKDWVRSQQGKPRIFDCDGVMIELDDGILYCIPFFLFTEETFAMLKPGWDRWLAAKEDYDEKENQSFLLEAQTRAYEQKRMRSRKLQQLQLNLQAYDAGLFDLWEVAMYPQTGGFGMPLSVVVPANDSGQAAGTAHRLNPSYVVGEIRIVRRRN